MIKMRNVEAGARDLIRRLHERGELRPISSGLPSLDQVTGGGITEGLIVLGGQPGVGKTAMAVQLACRAAEEGTPALFCSAELSCDEIIARCVAPLANRSARDLLHGHPDALAAAQHALDTGAATNLGHLYVVEDHQRGERGSVEFLGETAEAVAERHQAAPLLVADYAQRLTPTGANLQDNERVRVSRVVDEAAALAHDARFPLVLVAALNRGANGKEVPALDSFRETSAFEYGADLAMVMRWEQKAPEEKRIVELHVLKNRAGSLRDSPIRLYFDGRLGSFTEVGVGRPGDDVVSALRRCGGFWPSITVAASSLGVSTGEARRRLEIAKALRLIEARRGRNNSKAFMLVESSGPVAGTLDLDPPKKP